MSFAKRWLRLTFLVALIGLCAVLPNTAAAQTDDEELLDWWKSYLKQHMYNHEAWAAWVKEHAHPITLETSAAHDFSDLEPLKPLLADRRVVMLGESSHGVREYNLAKVRLIQFLHQEMGFDVIAFESSWADAYAVAALSDALSAYDMMEQSIYPVWHTEEVLALFEYIKETQTTARPLHVAGIDIQPLNAFSNLVGEWLDATDPAWGAAWREVESQSIPAVHAFEYPWDELPARRDDWILSYNALARYVQEHAEQLSSARPDLPDFAAVVLRAIDERIRVLNEFVEAKAMLMSPVFASLPTHAEQNYSYVRDLMMAENLTWLAEEMFPDKKIIVWGHNYHIRKQNSSVQDDPLFMGLPTPSLGELLPDRLQAQTYSIGLYMFSGTHVDNMRVVQEIPTAHDPDSIEAILQHAGYDVAFVDMKHQVPEVGNTWMFTDRKALYAGMFEESFIPRNQYDGILWFAAVQPPEYLGEL